MMAVDIVTMSVAEKLKLMEALWVSLSIGSDESFESPAWHEQSLKEAEGKLAAGSAHFVDWAGAKEQLRRAGQD